MLNIHNCPGTLAKGYSTYSSTCLRRVFDGKKVNHILPYDVPVSELNDQKLLESQRISISGVQEKFSVIQDKNQLRLVQEGEQGTHILKPIPRSGKNAEFMPANEQLTMQIARQVFGIETAENALVFFKNGEPAYITKRFDVLPDGSKRAVEDFAAVAKLSPPTHGEHYKYLGNYLDLFQLLQKHLPIYQIEAPKLFKLIAFNYLFSNGDAHYKNFSLLETPQGDYRLSPAYDLLNTRLHIEDADFALQEGLLPPQLAKGKIHEQFLLLAQHANIPAKLASKTLSQLSSHSTKVEALIQQSFLSEKLKRNYWQVYQRKVKRLGES